jgi:ADP-dependent NAD(P)H-hydrate dehydratase / NAD(P)H-hydrate epimerase
MQNVTQILSVEQMYAADQLAIDKGISGAELMENAGRGVTDYIKVRWDPCSLFVLCGPGNNGGDGYVIARILAEAGWPVSVFAYGDPERLKGDAARMSKLYDGTVLGFDELEISNDVLIVDAVFGAGFRGDLPPEMVHIFEAIDDAQLPVVAVDVPSGVDGNTGRASRGTLNADLTVTFFRPKFGHILYPGRAKKGELEIIDIGIPEEVLDELDCQVILNDPNVWGEGIPTLQVDGHKYNRGHVAICGGGISSTGAARISARNALRIGAGAVTLVCPSSALMVYASALEAVMVAGMSSTEDFIAWLSDKRIGVCLVGPANGVSSRTREFALAALSSPSKVVLDADALSVFKDDPETLFDAIKARGATHDVVLTPHAAEFERLFSVGGSAIERAVTAAEISGAIVVLKGATTVIADPRGRAVINTNAPAWLATAGSGDALAGLISGLCFGFDSCFNAASAAVWIHSEAAEKFGLGLLSEDIEKEIPNILQELEQYNY